MSISREDLDAGRVDLSDVIDPDAEPLSTPHPGTILREEWLEPLGITAYRLAEDIGVPHNRVTSILKGERAITADTALRLARYFGTDAQSWVNLQAAYDLDGARRQLAERLEAEVRVRVA